MLSDRNLGKFDDCELFAFATADSSRHIRKYVRLVHLTDATRRKGLMIIYAESLKGSGYTAAQLQEGGKDHARWAAIANGLIRRGERSVTIRTIADPDR